jgi:hypothetical protein
MNAWNYRPGVAALQRADPINRPGGPGTDPVPEPGTTAPLPITPATTDWAQRAADRTRRTRDFFAANPDRRPAPMGRNAGGAITYDPSGEYYHYFMRHGRGPNASGTNTGEKPAGDTPPGALTDPTKRGAFNAAISR